MKTKLRDFCFFGISIEVYFKNRSMKDLVLPCFKFSIRDNRIKGIVSSFYINDLCQVSTVRHTTREKRNKRHYTEEAEGKTIVERYGI